MPHPFNSDRPTDDPHIGIDRRKLLRGAAALAATAATMTAASAETVTPFGQTAVPLRSTEPLPLGPLPGGRYPDSHLESLKKPRVSFGPAGFPAFAGTMAVERVATGNAGRAARRQSADSRTATPPNSGRVPAPRCARRYARTPDHRTEREP